MALVGTGSQIDLILRTETRNVSEAVQPLLFQVGAAGWQNPKVVSLKAQNKGDYKYPHRW